MTLRLSPVIVFCAVLAAVLLGAQQKGQYVHRQKQGTNGICKTPGQAFTDEWGAGQILPLSKDLSKLLRVGAIDYDQWQTTDNGGTFAITVLVATRSCLAVPGHYAYPNPLARQSEGNSDERRNM